MVDEPSDKSRTRVRKFKDWCRENGGRASGGIVEGRGRKNTISCDFGEEGGFVAIKHKKGMSSRESDEFYIERIESGTELDINKRATGANRGIVDDAGYLDEVRDLDAQHPVVAIDIEDADTLSLSTFDAVADMDTGESEIADVRYELEA